MVLLHEQLTDIEEIRAEFNSKFNICESGLGEGAQFWVNLPEENGAAEKIVEWQVVFRHHYENWSGAISSESPRKILQTPNLGGIFHVKVLARLADEAEMTEIEPQTGSNRNIGCNSNCAAMIGITLTADGENAEYWTVWDAICMADEDF